jgi:hypothetical protein
VRLADKFLVLSDCAEAQFALRSQSNIEQVAAAIFCCLPWHAAQYMGVADQKSGLVNVIGGSLEGRREEVFDLSWWSCQWLQPLIRKMLSTAASFVST